MVNTELQTKCDKCGFVLSDFEGRTSGCTHASCGGTFVRQYPDAGQQTCEYTLEARVIAWRDGKMLDHSLCNHLPEVTGARHRLSAPHPPQR